MATDFPVTHGARASAAYLLTEFSRNVFCFSTKKITIMSCYALFTKRRCHIECLEQDYSISIANALEILQPCTKPSISVFQHRNLWTWVFIVKMYLITNHKAVEYHSVCPLKCLTTMTSPETGQWTLIETVIYRTDRWSPRQTIFIRLILDSLSLLLKVDVK